jgi:hypothetical protein
MDVKTEREPTAIEHLMRMLYLIVGMLTHYTWTTNEETKQALRTEIINGLDATAAFARKAMAAEIEK